MPELKSVSTTLVNYIKSNNGNDIPDFSPQLDKIKDLEKEYKKYKSNISHFEKGGQRGILQANRSQKNFAETFNPFFAAIHDALKTIDKKARHYEKEHTSSKESKIVKTELDELHKSIKDAEYFFTHINWLQERFPEAKYEDVTGLCKLATLDEVKEQDYSLNPGRYVGVVIEEDGKTEEEFVEEILKLNKELSQLNNKLKLLCLLEQ